MMQPLGNLQPQARFRINALGLTGQLLSSDLCACRVRVQRPDGKTETTYWAPGTIVEIDMDTEPVEIITDDGETKQGLRCPVCGKTCTSTSGLTLHKKATGHSGS